MTTPSMRAMTTWPNSDLKKDIWIPPSSLESVGFRHGSSYPEPFADQLSF